MERAPPALRGGRDGDRATPTAGRPTRSPTRSSPAGPDAVTATAPTRITVARRRAPYDVVVGDRLLGELPAPARGGGRAGRWSSTRARWRDRPRPCERDLRRGGLDGRARRGARRRGGQDASTSPRPAGPLLGRRGFTRTDAVVGVGGGAITDLAGFVAATWLRGVRVVHVPTTLLGMVDAAVGGKTGINTAEGKNLVGAFHPPAGVLCDLDALATLPAARLRQRAGRGRQGGLHRRPGDPRPRRGRPGAARSTPAGAALRELVERAVRVKADVVSRGPARAAAVREVLNYGHTLGHAIEQVEVPLAARRRRGGRAGVRRRARPLAGRLDDADVDAAPRRCSTSLGLPTTVPAATRGPSCATRCGSTRRRAATGCGSSCSTASAGPAGSRAPTRPAGRASLRRRGVDRDPRAGAQRPEPRPARHAASPRSTARRPTTTSSPLCAEAGAELGLEVEVRQTDDEAELVGWLHEAADAATPVVLNPAAFTHYSYALRDAVRACCTAPLVEVHLIEPGRPRGVPAHSVVAGGRDRHDRRLRARLVPAGAAGDRRGRRHA